MGVLGMISTLKKALMLLDWVLRVMVKLLCPIEECLLLAPFLMNIIAWNCRGARKPAFKNYVRELVHIHDLAILIVMETRVGGDRAKEITDDLPV